MSAKANPNPAFDARPIVDGMVREIQRHLTLVKTDEQDRLVALHQAAENAFSMGLHYARAGNYKGASRKAVQALSALNTLQAAGAGRRGQIGGAA